MIIGQVFQNALEDVQQLEIHCLNSEPHCDEASNVIVLFAYRIMVV